MKDHDFTENFGPLFAFWDEQIRRVGARKGYDPHPPDYRFARPKELVSTYAYIGVPTFPGTWNNGKEFLSWMFKFNLPDGHPDKAHAAWELIINSNPVVTYMNTEARMPLNCHILGHANIGHSHFFKHNHRFKGTDPEHVLERFSRMAQRLEQLANDPEFGIDRLEYTADAAHVIAKYCSEVSDRLVSEKELRERLESELRRLQALRKRPGSAVGFDREELDRQIKLIADRLKRDPINRRRDIVSFILDKEQNPGLSDNEREVIWITAEVARYFNAQMGTQHMNESFAELAAQDVLKDPQTCLPPNYRALLSLYFWNAFEKDPTNRYKSPYWLGRFIYEKLVAKLCPVTGHSMAPAPVFQVVPNPNTGKARLKKLDTGKVQGDPEHQPHQDSTRLMTDESGNLLEFTGLYRLVEVEDKDLSPIFDIVEKYIDLTFFHTYLDFETLEEVHEKTMHWIDERFEQVTRNLRAAGWVREAWADPVPRSLDEKLKKVEQWLGLFEQSQEQPGPDFPAYEQELIWMAQLLSLIKGYYANRRVFRERHIANLALSRVPDISVVDGGIESANATTSKGRQLVIEHIYDALSGQLLESWARESTKKLPRIFKGGGGVKILTVKEETNDDDEVTGTVPWYYAADAEGKLTEGRIY
jgi:spore cortex formation protein SpoVR/YcgB (stage V sporulation)